MSVNKSDMVNVTSRQVSCDGGDGALGHPRVYLNMGVKDSVDCPYCGKSFHLVADQKKAS